MGNIGAAIESAFFMLIAWVIVITAAVTAGLIYGIPWAWGYIKPWLHTVTG